MPSSKEEVSRFPWFVDAGQRYHIGRYGEREVFSGGLVQNNHVHDNGQLGIFGYKPVGAIVQNNEIDHNGTLSNRGDACGIKLHGTKGTDSGAYNIVTGNVVHDNAGHGLWVDCDGHDNTLAGLC